MGLFEAAANLETELRNESVNPDSKLFKQKLREVIKGISHGLTESA